MNKILKTSLREAYKGLNPFMKREFFRKVAERFPHIRQSTVYNWMKEYAYTTPDAEVCEFIATFFNADIKVMFPNYEPRKEEEPCKQQ